MSLKLTLKRSLVRKLTRRQLLPFLEAQATPALTLDVGAKQSGYRHLFPNAVAGDIAAYPGLNTQFDAHRLPFVSSSFPVILCTEVLEHCTNPQQVIDEFFRVLQPGGKLILTTRFIFPIHDAPHDYFRFTQYGLLHLCRRFASVTIQPESATLGTLGILLQRLAAQARWRIPGTGVALQIAARILLRSSWLLYAEFGDVKRQVPARSILASGYYLVAVKGP
jgi:SAM-dependent methyltransferase